MVWVITVVYQDRDLRDIDGLRLEVAMFCVNISINPAILIMTFDYSGQ
jgi:hypothetical protein